MSVQLKEIFGEFFAKPAAYKMSKVCFSNFWSFKSLKTSYFCQKMYLTNFPPSGRLTKRGHPSISVGGPGPHQSQTLNFWVSSIRNILVSTSINSFTGWVTHEKCKNSSHGFTFFLLICPHPCYPFYPPVLIQELQKKNVWRKTIWENNGMTKDHLRNVLCDEVSFEKTFEWRSPNWESVKNVAWKGYFVTTKVKSDNLWRRMKIQTIKITFVPTSESSLKWKMMNQLKRNVSFTIPFEPSNLHGLPESL